MDSENKEARCSGFIFAIGLFLIIFVLSYLMVQYPDMVADSQANKIAKSLSSIQSRINVQPTTISLSLPTDSFVYDAQGGGVIGDSLMSFNAGSNDLSFGVSYPLNSGKQKSVEVSLSGKRDGAKYLFTVKKARMIKSVEFQVSGLDTSLNWYLDGRRVIPSDDGILSASYEFRQGNGYIILRGYGSDNRLCDGVIIKIV